MPQSCHMNTQLMCAPSQRLELDESGGLLVSTRTWAVVREDAHLSLAWLSRRGVVDALLGSVGEVRSDGQEYAGAAETCVD